MKKLSSIILCMFPLAAFAQGSGDCLDLDGTNDFVLIDGSFPDVGSADDFTITAWIYTTNRNETGQRVWCDDENNAAGSYALSLGDPGGGRLRFYTRNTNPISLDVPNTAALLIDNNRWTHVAAVHISSTRTKQIYVNGVLAASGTYTGTLPASNGTSPCSIGGETDLGETGNRFRGRIDEVTFWTVALSEAEIRNMMCRSLVGNEPGLLAYYNMDGVTIGAGNVTDLTGNGYNGTMTNMTAGDVILSGAAIGNTSVFTYPGIWTGVTLTHMSPEGDQFEISSVTGSPAGYHIYHVESVPNSTTGINGLGGNDHYYGVFKCNDATSIYTATYFYADNDAFQASDPAIVEADMRMYRRDDNADPTWADSGGIPNAIANTITATGMNTEYILGILGGSGLPVEWLSFQVIAEEKDNVLLWATATEQNASHFEVQRSLDGYHFETIGTVEAAGNTSSQSNYTFMDSQPPAGLAYYRLKQVDLDGAFEFSEVVALVRQDEGELLVFPNPSDGYLTITMHDKNAPIDVYNAHGKWVRSFFCSSNPTDLTDLGPGMYMMVVRSTGKSARFVIK